VTWQDFGAEDHLAVFAGKGGIIEPTAPARVNRLVFRSNCYTFRGQAIEWTGTKPSIQLADSVRAVFALPVRIAGAAELAPGSYSAATHPDLIVGGGILVVAPPQ